MNTKYFDKISILITVHHQANDDNTFGTGLLVTVARMDERPLLNWLIPELIKKIKTGSHLAQVQGEQTRASVRALPKFRRCTMHPPNHPHASTLIITRLRVSVPHIVHIILVFVRRGAKILLLCKVLKVLARYPFK